jgi:hypothetical protein
VLCVLQIKSVKAVESVYRVTVTITKGCIEIQGLQSEVSEATSAIHSILARAREEKFAGVLTAEVRTVKKKLQTFVYFMYAKLVPK